MHHVARRSLSSASRIACLASSSSTASRRLRIRSTRILHTTAYAGTPVIFPFPKPDNSDDRAEPIIASGASDGDATERSSTVPGADTASEISQSSQVRSAAHGSMSKRSTRTKAQQKQGDINPIEIPAWFYRQNVRIQEDPPTTALDELEIVHKSGKLMQHGDARLKEADATVEDRERDPQSTRSSDHVGQDGPPTYRLHEAIMTEITTSIAAGLSLSQEESSNSFAVEKSHLKLHCPVDGGVYFLEAVVEVAATQLNADIIRIDAQDIAEIAGDYISEGRDATSNAVWTLGYDTQQMFPRSHSHSSEVDEIVTEADEAEGLEDMSENPAGRPTFASVTAIPVMGVSGNLNLGDLFKNLKEQGPGMNTMFAGGGRSGGRGSSGVSMGQAALSRWDEHKLSELLKVLLGANHQKRAQRGHLMDPRDTVARATTPNPGSTKTIILIRGIKEMTATAQGGPMLDKMFDIVVKKRKGGEEIIIVGTTASTDLTPETSRSGIRALQAEAPELPYRTIVVAPEAADAGLDVYYLEERRRLREINIRHIQDMVHRLDMGSNHRALDHDEFAARIRCGSQINSITSLLEEHFLTLEEVHRIAMLAVGEKERRVREGSESTTDRGVSADDVVAAVRLIEASDAAKVEWVKHERQVQRLSSDAEAPKASASDVRLKRLRKSCNRHEKSLLSGVVDAENIKTTFADVHAPAETIEALKMLTTLSLTRPDAFKYGVLAKDKITGVLLYGPPGTGKTLLAKAVAKESGATVLEISGSDVYDMYVGESEKNVRAIFSLAKKLSPCVVFIDEADAIFASRGSGTNRNSHRELINQFLREWDGMTETSAFIMVATNRPFDLDDAALRRLPRRLLVDLPVEKDREDILGIHLKDEALDGSVSLTQLAALTPLYSGSDLKNLAVAAALAAVREENVEKAKHTGDGEYAFPPKRTLHRRHFDKAMEEISASVSEDMSSLGAIRKFDERYGDRRGRRKKTMYGFGSEKGIKEQAVKVRPMQAV